MPILALPFVAQPVAQPLDTTRMDSRTLAFRDLDGNYPFSLSDHSFIFGPDSEGIDMPPREIITRAIPGLEGKRLGEIKINEREVFLPFVIHSASHVEHLNKRDELARLFNYRQVDYRAQDGTFDLVANSVRGERSLRCIYVDGMTSGRAPNERATWQKLGVTLLAVRPYWTGQPWATPEMRLPTPVSWPSPFPFQFTSGNAIGGTAQVIVEGDAESWVRIEMIGPAESVSITGKDFSFSVPDGIAAGEILFFNSDPRQRTCTFSGVKDWTRVGPSDRYAPLQPGTRELSLSLVGATSESMVQMSGDTAFERPW